MMWTEALACVLISCYAVMLGIADLNQIADLKLSILAPIQIAEMNLTPCFNIGCGYGYGTVSVVGNATGTVPYL